ncbi:MAG: hypothetical protein N2508_07495 [Anaerolineae bacterium]|nr:hypothetical protein [Anaerolineae bacterium]
MEDLTSSGVATRIGLFLGKHLPRRLGYGLAHCAARLIAVCRPAIYRTVRANLRQVLGAEVADRTLHDITRQLFYHAGQCYYDFFNAVAQPPEKREGLIHIPEPFFEHVHSEAKRGRGVLLLGLHMSNFDLIFLALGARGMPVQVLSLADPTAGFRILNRLRGVGALRITPISPAALRQAIQLLNSGGIVATGVDRPIPQDRELIEFFGRPAFMPLGPARLAVMTGASTFVGGCYYTPGQGYALQYTGPLEIARTGDKRQDILTTARSIIAIVEDYVRARPEQWLMFHPVWPEA